MSKIIAFIPARKGSKRLRGKNKKVLGGKPLICWTIDEALKTYHYERNEDGSLYPLFDEVIVSTDDSDIKNIVRDKYVDRRITLLDRVVWLAQDWTEMWEVIKYELYDYDPDTIIVLLQPTSPFRKAYQIRECVKLYKKYQIPVVSCYWRGGINNKIRINGAIYVVSLKQLLKNKSFIFKKGTLFYFMDKKSSVDIDTQEDWDYAESLLEKGGI